MTTLQRLCKILSKANPCYIVEYEESSMMNVKADNYKRGDSFIYIEEFTQGRYAQEQYRRRKITQVQVYFCKFCNLHADAMEREKIRNRIEEEIVLPFIDEFNKSKLFPQVDNFQFYNMLPRFDANEVSIMLQFEVRADIC